MLGTASDTFRILACLELRQFRYIQTYSSIFSIIKTHSGMLRHYLGIFTLIQAYSEPCEILTRHIENSIQAFSHIQTYSEPCITFAHAETWHIRNLGIL